MLRLLKTLAVGALAYGGYVAVKKLLDEQDQETGSSSTTPTTSPSSSSSPSRPASSTPASTVSNGDGGPSKAELYEQAQKLDIKGRSKMSKSELERAVREAG